jgi:hypothetical protein
VQASFDGAAAILTRRMIVERRVNGRLRRSRETHRIRVYTRRQMAAALRRAGFAVTMRRSFGRCRLIAGDLAVVARKSARI